MPRNEMTTIKVSKGLRDRISADAARQDQSVQRFIETILDDHERRRRLAALSDAIAATDQETFNGWRAETTMWEAIDAEESST